MTAPDATLRGFLGYGLKRAFNVLQAEVNATLAPMGLRMMTFSVLAVIRDAPGISAAGLAQVLGLERPNLVVILDELEGAGLITRTRARTDRRTHELRVTLAGRKLAARATDALTAHEDRITSGLDGVQREAMRAGLARIEDKGRHRE